MNSSSVYEDLNTIVNVGQLLEVICLFVGPQLSFGYSATLM